MRILDLVCIYLILFVWLKSIHQSDQASAPICDSQIQICMCIYIYTYTVYIYDMYIYIHLTSQSIVNLASESTSLPPWPGRCRVAKKRFCRYLDTIAVRLNGEPDHQAGELGCRLRRTWQFHRCADWGSIGWIAKSVCTYLFIYLSLSVYICVCVCMHVCMHANPLKE